MIDTSAGVLVRKRIYLDDLDGFGMLHHARYALLLDNAVIDFWADAGWEIDPSVSVLVIRELTLTYHQPVVGLSEVDVHFWIERAGRTSVTYRFQLLSADHEVVHADGHRVVVNLDGKTLRPAPIGEDVWELAAPLLGPGVARSAA
jgi:acyl-CoA thioester hydrolase